jgi:polysaccharide export outer membrane protein
MNRFFLVFIVVILCLVTSCARYEKLLYLNTSVDKAQSALYTDYELKPQDALYIRIVSADLQINSLFRAVGEERTSVASEASLYLTSYIIDNDSTISLPVVGKMLAAGMSVSEFEKKLQKTIDEIVIETHVSVRLINYRVTVIGEIGRPGVYQIYQPNATIFDALAKAGDISNSGNRNEISVLRIEKDVTINYKINLGNIDALKSPVYYIYPNDVIYVKPLKYKTARENIPIFTLILSTVTTFLLIMTFIKN